MTKKKAKTFYATFLATTKKQYSYGAILTEFDLDTKKGLLELTDYLCKENKTKDVVILFWREVK